MNTVTVQKDNTILDVNNIEREITRKHRPFKLSFREMTVTEIHEEIDDVITIIEDDEHHHYVKITDKIETGRIFSCYFTRDYSELLHCETVN